MPTINAALGALARHCRFNTARANAIARRLQDSGVLPKGGPNNPPQINGEGFAALFLALASDTTIAAAPANVATLLSATPGGASLDGAPASIGTARSELLALVETALDEPDDLEGFAIEVVTNWPEIAISQFGKVIGRYQQQGTISGHWQSRGHRRSTTVTGAAFRDAVRSTFKGNS